MKALAFNQSGLLHLLDDRLVGRWRRGAVEDTVATEVACAVQLLDLAFQRSEVLELAEVHSDVKHALQKGLQDLRIDGLRSRELVDDFGRMLAETVVIQVVESGTNHREPGR